MKKPNTIRKPTGPAAKASIDLHLAVAAAMNLPGQEWSDVELGEFCGCHHSLIQQIEAKALKKLRMRPSTMKLCAEMLRAPRYATTLKKARGRGETDYVGFFGMPQMAAA